MEEYLLAFWAWLSARWTSFNDWVQVGDNLNQVIWILIWAGIAAFFVAVVKTSRSRRAYWKLKEDRDAYFDLAVKQKKKLDELEKTAGTGGIPGEIDLNVTVTLDTSADFDDLVKGVVRDVLSIVTTAVLSKAVQNGRVAGYQGPQGMQGLPGTQGFGIPTPGKGV